MFEHSRICRLASALEGVRGLEARPDRDKRTEQLTSAWENIRDEIMGTIPSGSGFDSGTDLDAENTKPDMIVFNTSFHHMDEHGCYAKWTDHRVVVRPDFGTITLSVRGSNYRDIKPHIHDIFWSWLVEEIPSGEWHRIVSSNVKEALNK